MAIASKFNSYISKPFEIFLFGSNKFESLDTDPSQNPPTETVRSDTQLNRQPTLHRAAFFHETYILSIRRSQNVQNFKVDFIGSRDIVYDSCKMALYVRFPFLLYFNLSLLIIPLN